MGFPDGELGQNIIGNILATLDARGLIRVNGRSVTGGPGDVGANGLTELGEAFLRFISSPL